MNKEVLSRMENQIKYCEEHLQILLSICEEAGNFSSFYPLQCLEKMQLMNVIVKCELHGPKIDIAKLYNDKIQLEKEILELEKEMEKEKINEKKKVR